MKRTFLFGSSKRLVVGLLLLLTDILLNSLVDIFDGHICIGNSAEKSRFAENIAVGGFEFCFGGFFFCRTELQACAHEFGGVEGLGSFAVNLVLTQHFQQLGAVLRVCLFHCGEGGFDLCNLALHLWNVFIVGAF